MSTTLIVRPLALIRPSTIIGGSVSLLLFIGTMATTGLTGLLFITGFIVLGTLVYEFVTLQTSWARIPTRTNAAPAMQGQPRHETHLDLSREGIGCE